MSDVTEIDGVCAIRSTAKALLVQIGMRPPVWVPRSQIAPWSQVWDAGQRGTLVLARWLAERVFAEEQPRHEQPRHPAPVNLDPAARVYRNLAMKWHPDHAGPRGTEVMQDINQLWTAVKQAVER